MGTRKVSTLTENIVIKNRIKISREDNVILLFLFIKHIITIILMKNLFLFMVVVIFTACSSNNNWEYKTVTITGESDSEFVSNTFNVTDEDLNLFGAEGWELVNVYTLQETVFPNFGNEKYVTGIRENTRTKSINYVFKRQQIINIDKFIYALYSQLLL